MYRICGYLYTIIFRKRIIVFEPGHSLYYVLVHEYRYMYCSSTALGPTSRYTSPIRMLNLVLRTALPDFGALLGVNYIKISST